MIIGSLFSGYRGLDMAAERFFGAETAWWSDIDPGAIKINQHHWPDQPNLGDITTVDWSQVEPVDIITGGFPCQDVSLAGKRAGMRPDTRSGLWTHMAYAISQLRPRYVVAENVRGLLSASADVDLESCPWCLGDPEQREPDLRALGAVLGDLADIGYDAQWVGLRAADVGAPHGRFRIFILATDARGERYPGNGSGRAEEPGLRITDARHNRATTDATGQRHRNGRPSSLRGISAATVAGAPADPNSVTFGAWDRDERPSSARGRSAISIRRDSVHATPTYTESGTGRGPKQSDLLPHLPGPGGEQQSRERTGPADPGSTWGPYRAAIERWERSLGRVAPQPTEPGPRDGRPRLSPTFVEFMMGLPAGHVTDVPGLGRNAQLKALGNGVVPQQAYAALQLMTDSLAVAS